MVTKSYVLARIEAMERELTEFRRKVVEPEMLVRNRKSLYGILGDVDFSEKEIRDARQSLLRDDDATVLDP